MTTTTDAGLRVLAEHRGWFRTLGIAWIALGALAIAVPLAASIAIELLVGVLLLVGGVVQAAQMFRVHGWGGRILALLLGVLYGGTGLVLLAFPMKGLLTLTLVLAVCWSAAGSRGASWPSGSDRGRAGESSC